MCVALNQTEGPSCAPVPHAGVPLFQNRGRLVSWCEAAGASKGEVRSRASEPKHLLGRLEMIPPAGPYRLPQPRRWVIMLSPYTDPAACVHLGPVPSL